MPCSTAGCLYPANWNGFKAPSHLVAALQLIFPIFGMIQIWLYAFLDGSTWHVQIQVQRSAPAAAKWSQLPTRSFGSWWPVVGALARWICWTRPGRFCWGFRPDGLHMFEMSYLLDPLVIKYGLLEIPQFMDDVPIWMSMVDLLLPGLGTGGHV